jgi:hypothetical protein
MPLETYFGHRITPGLPGEASLLLYTEPKHGGLQKDGQGYHHLPPTPQPWGTRQMKVTYSLDTTLRY